MSQFKSLNDTQNWDGRLCKYQQTLSSLGHRSSLRPNVCRGKSKTRDNSTMSSQHPTPSPPSSPTPSHQSDQTGESGLSPARLFACYLLASQSTKPRSKNRTYIGFTVNPSRRLRQHNGDLRYGGACRTKAHRPWATVAVIHGFISKTQALQFEWAWQHPARSLTLRTHANRPGALPTPKSRYTVRGALSTLAALVSVPPWARCPLSLTICAERDNWESLGIESLTFPPHFPTSFAPLGTFDASIGSYSFRQPADVTVPYRPPSGCPACNTALTIPRRRLSYCTSCGAVAHLACFAARSVPHEGDSETPAENPPVDPLIPDAASCAACGYVMHWSLVVRLAHSLSSDD